MRVPKVFLFSALMFLCSCDLIDLPSSNGDEQIAGEYEASTYVTVGRADGAVDILEAGGSLEMRLGEDRELRGHVFISENTGSFRQQGVDTTFSGTYSVSGDTVDFDIDYHQLSLLDDAKAKWGPKKERIETCDLEGLLTPFRVVLVCEE